MAFADNRVNMYSALPIWAIILLETLLQKAIFFFAIEMYKNEQTTNKTAPLCSFKYNGSIRIQP